MCINASQADGSPHGLDSSATFPSACLPRALQTAASPLLEAALDLAGRGWLVFPCASGAKRPAVRDWERRATTDPVRISRCWEHSHCNIGIACGPSALVVLDLDKPKNPRPGLGPDPEPLPAGDGAQVLARLC